MQGIEPYSDLLSRTARDPRQKEDMVLLPGAAFLMGCEGGSEFEAPVHEVSLDAFLMDVTPVTNQQFAEFTTATGYRTSAERAGAAWGFRDGRFHKAVGLCWRNYGTPGRGDHPVVLVSWTDANEYARWAGKSLPTEAQWEYAARGGLASRLYPWGDDAPDGTQCNFSRPPAEEPPTTAVRAFLPNAFGLYDMVGNVWQWCRDWYDAGAYSRPASRNPAGPLIGKLKVRRGGSWNVIQEFRLRTANRGAMDIRSCAPNIGLRCVKEIKEDPMRGRSLPRPGSGYLSRIEGKSADARTFVFPDRLAEVAVVLDEMRPAMQADGGDVELLSMGDGGIVYVRLLGSCLNCPSASLTLTIGLEQTLRRRLPWVQGISRIG